MTRPLHVAIFLLLMATALCAAPFEKYYEIESIPDPPGVATPTVGGVAFTPGGRFVAAFLSGEVCIYDPSQKSWKLFAEGLQTPLGVYAESEHQIIVAQGPELTRLVDTDGDGVADDYQTICDGYGVSGNYHEFAFGPAVDVRGDFFLALGCGSSAGSGVMPEKRGEFRANGRNGPMFSCVPYRGWVVKIDREGRLTPWASGFREPNGIGFDMAGNLLATDNQGDWLGSSKLIVVKKGRFYGHPAGLVWNEGFTGDPLKTPLEELQRMKSEPAVYFPHGVMASSPTQPLADSTGGKFGPFAGQVLVGEMNVPRILRVMLEEVDGEWQGACVPMIDGPPLVAGAMRMAFAPDGSLWVGHAKRSYWVGGQGVHRISYRGTPPLDVLAMHATPVGFELRFTRPLDPVTAKSIASYSFKRYFYEYHAAYGSPQMDAAAVPVTEATLGADRTNVSLKLGEMKPGYIYELQLKGLRANDGDALLNPLICYTLNRLKR
jgi:glucose/arabinose dehydrogenase